MLESRPLNPFRPAYRVDESAARFGVEGGLRAEHAKREPWFGDFLAARHVRRSA